MPVKVDGNDVISMTLGIAMVSYGFVAIVTAGDPSGLEAGEAEIASVIEAETAAANCFVVGTPVATAAGLLAIDRIRVGDAVLSRNEHTGAQSLRRVVRTMVHQASELVHVRTATDTITATPNHPFWVQGRGWVEADTLAWGDTLVLADGGRADIVSLTREKLASPVDVYNLEVEGYHTYFVASSGVWVHNCGVDAAEWVAQPARQTPGFDGGSSIIYRQIVEGETNAVGHLAWDGDGILAHCEFKGYVGRLGSWASQFPEGVVRETPYLYKP